MTLKRTIKLLKEYLRMDNLNVIELTNVNKYRLSDCNWTRTHNHLVHTRTLNHLAKLAK